MVLFMTPGLVFFYGGLVRRKNVLNTMMASFFTMGLSTAMWVLFGYSLSFSGNIGGIIGDFSWIGLNNVGGEPGPYADTIPHLLFALFQMMFAIITPALLTGAIAGRMRFKELFAFIAMWLLVVYYPLAHMVWGKGGILGLVAITPGAGFVPIWASIIIGIFVSPICYFTMSVVKKHFGYDDALDAFGCHGVGGIWGGIATGLFAKTSINPVARWDGLIFGDTQLFVAQIVSIIITIAIAVVGTYICATLVKLFTPLRVSDYDERVGLDISQHGESAYPSFNGLD